MRALAWLVVGLRWLILPAWVIAAVAATTQLPALSSAGSAPLDDLVAGNGRAAAQEQFATSHFGFPLYTDTVVVARRLPAGGERRTLTAAQAVRAQRTPDLPGLKLVLPTFAPSGSTAVSYLYFG